MKRLWEACLGLALLVFGAMTLGVGICTVNLEIPAVVSGHFVDSLSVLVIAVLLFASLAIICRLIFNELIRSLSNNPDRENGENP